MGNFIELTRNDTEEKVSINLNHVYCINPSVNGKETFVGLSINNGDDFYIVKESYEQIKTMLGVSDETKLA